jgi:hypothetical protein
VKHDLVAPAGRDDLPVTPAKRAISPPAILDKPRLAHGVHLASADGEGFAIVARRDGNAARNG